MFQPGITENTHRKRYMLYLRGMSLFAMATQELYKDRAKNVIVEFLGDIYQSKILKDKFLIYHSKSI
jgi:hypothetical protein